MSNPQNLRNFILRGLALAGCAVLGVARAQEPSKLPDEPTFRQIFHQSVEEASTLTSSRRRDSLTLELSGTFRSPETLTLTNPYFKIQHADQLDRLLGFGLGVYAGLLGSESAQLGAGLNTGFSYVEYVGRAQALKTGLVALDSLSLQVIPLSLGVRGSYALGPVSLFAEPALGVQWIGQSGSLDGDKKNFRVPTWGVTGGVLIFDRVASSAGRWFGGLRLAAGVEKSLSDEQRLAMRHFELGLRMRL